MKNNETKMMLAKHKKETKAALIRKVTAFQREMDGHVRRLVARPHEVLILVNVVDMVGLPDAGILLKGPGPGPSGWAVQTIVLAAKEAEESGP
jgi:hypothetical protein